MSHFKYQLRHIIPYALNKFISRMRQGLNTIFGRLYAAWWGVNLGKSVRFFGLPIFQKHPTATIVIGNDAIFRSAEWSNSIGINRRCIIAAGRDAKITIGDYCGFSGTVIAASHSITIGQRVLCGANCTIVDNDRHPTSPVARANKGKANTSPVVIGDDVFLGMNVVVLKGVSIGKGTVVSANSVVSRSLPSGVVAGGMPAKILKNIHQ